MTKPTDTKEALMTTAMELMWRSNYASVGVAEICTNAGVTKGGFYHHFESKADLFYQATQHCWEDKRSTLDAIFSPSNSALEQLEGVIAYIIQRQEEMAETNPEKPVTGCPLFSAAAQVGSGEEKVRQAALEVMEKLLQYNCSLARNLKDQGVSDTHLPPEQLGRLMHQYIHGIMQYGRLLRDLDAIKLDLRDGLYQILGVKAEYR